MDFLFLLFIFLSATIIIGSSYYIYLTGRHLTTFIFFGGFLALTVMFGLKWFRSDGSLNQSTVGSWPPIINVCPDFLSLTSVNGRAVCVDTVGVAPNGGIQQNDGTQTAENTIFDLLADNTNSSARAAALCKQCSDMILTWEGVYDGSSCLKGEPPYPPVPGSSSLSMRVTSVTPTNSPGSLVAA
jgi:hypothetical protein